jgi:FkbM family methyltransferase
MTIIDVGVNKGYFSLISAKLMDNTGKVYAIEPDSTNCSWIKKSIKKNNYKNIELFQIALSNKNEEICLYKGFKSGDHSIKKDRGLGFQMVKAQRLDDFVKKHNIKRVDLIKIDVEGAEVEVIQGGEKLLEQKNLNLIIDIHDINKKKLYHLLNKQDFELYKFKHGKTERIYEDDFLKSNINEIYAKKIT